MAQTLVLPPVILPGSIPSSPDPTPLRLIAFSVAEAALQSDPNSPSLTLPSSVKSPLTDDWFDSWSAPESKDAFKPSPLGTDVKRGEANLWDVLERGKERRGRTPSPEQHVSGLPSTSPVAPTAYRFTLPPNLPLAASIASTPEHHVSPRGLSPKARTLGPRLDLSRWSKAGTPFPLFTRSVEPSPTKSTFSALDQSRPPPEFFPRDGEVVNKKEAEQLDLRADRPRSNGYRSTTMPSSRHNSRLPSLAQIQAKMAKSGHRRGSSVDGIPPAPPADQRSVYRTTSNDSVEVLRTPTDEFPPKEPQIVYDSPERRTATPPTPSDSGKESRLAPFLRERTSGRLAGARNRPVSMPPLSGVNINLLAFAGKPTERPGVTLTPPRHGEFRSFASVPPSSPSRSIILNTPPRKFTPQVLYSSPASPTSTNRSATASPTLSVPIITCTPAPQRFIRDGVELDSDEEGGDVVLFEGDSESVEGDDSPGREERERRARRMLERLTQRRRSD